MRRGYLKKAQAATELAVFGAILIFVIGAIVRTAIGNSYAQNQNFKAMRMAMLASWNGAKAGTTNRSSASVLFLEDRLSPDFNKYGALDRSPFIANGSGTFTYELLYPLDVNEVASMLPIMDIYINGQHFPFTTASYVKDKVLDRPVCLSNTPTEVSATNPTLSQAQCLENQCLRNQREWVDSAGQTVNQGQFAAIVPVTLAPGATATASNNASQIFTKLAFFGMIKNPQWNATPPTATVAIPVVSGAFVSWYNQAFPGRDQVAQIAKIQKILQSNNGQYKLFYAQAVNGTDKFVSTPPICSSHPCKDKELSLDLVLKNANGTKVSNITGDLIFDLRRNNDVTQIEQALPSCGAAQSCLRNYMAWQWYATAGTDEGMIGLDASNNQYPQWDIDGRLKTVTIYAIRRDATGAPTVSYEDFQGGDIDGSWDANSCGPKPGLLNDAQIYTFTKAGTYLHIKEGKLYNPETNQFVRSANQRDTIDLIQRMIQLSNNTGRFCDAANKPLSTVDKDGVTPNPVEVCADSSSASPTTCFTSNNIAQTCFDAADKMLFVRSRLEDRRGRFWMTDTTGQMKVR